MPEINDILLTHLHVDQYHDLSYLLPFSAWGGRWKQPLPVTDPSGRTPELGTKAMVAGMKQMLKWHLEAFDACPIGDGYEVEVNEFDRKDENGSLACITFLVQFEAIIVRRLYQHRNGSERKTMPKRHGMFWVVA
jgi:ribonuclease BN (tRNA processing enzyme)